MRRPLVVLLIAVAATSAGLVACASSGVSDDSKAIAAEVRLWFSIEADAAPKSGIQHGMEVVLDPICFSRPNGTYVRVEATPVTNGRLGQNIPIYLRQVPGGYRVLGVDYGAPDLPPLAIPHDAYEDLERPACDVTAKLLGQLLSLRARHLVPDIKY